jgi:uncharacterized membrane protein YphA (DoxX/SURF4 family)
MNIIRRFGHLFMSGIFVVSGIDTWRNPGSYRAGAASRFTDIASKVGLPEEPEQLVRVNSVVHVVGGLMLAKNLFPRLAALALASSLVPTTLGAHAFWEKSDPKERATQRIQFLKNLGLFGGLLLTVAEPHHHHKR